MSNAAEPATLATKASNGSNPAAALSPPAEKDPFRGGRTDTLRKIELPEGVEIHVRVAGPLPRSLAWLIDFAILVGILICINIITALLAVVLQEGAVGIALIIWFVALSFYDFIFEVWRGATPGTGRLCQLHGHPQFPAPRRSRRRHGGGLRRRDLHPPNPSARPGAALAAAGRAFQRGATGRGRVRRPLRTLVARAHPRTRRPPRTAHPGAERGHLARVRGDDPTDRVARSAAQSRPAAAPVPRRLPRSRHRATPHVRYPADRPTQRSGVARLQTSLSRTRSESRTHRPLFRRRPATDRA